MNERMDYNEICRNLIKDDISSNHTRMFLKNNNILSIDIIDGLNNTQVEVGFSLYYGTLMRLKSGLAHLIEHLISNKINDKVKDLDGSVTSRTHLDTMIIGFNIPYIKSKYIKEDKNGEYESIIADMLDVISDSIREACDIDYIKSNISNEINIIKSELSLNESNQYDTYRSNYMGYLTKDLFMLDIAVGGRVNRIDELNDPEMVYDAMRYLISSNPRFSIRVPFDVNSLRFFSYYNYFICREYNEFFNFVPNNTAIFETNFFKPNYDNIHESNEGDLKVIEIGSDDPKGLQNILYVKIPDVKSKEDWIDQITKVNLLNTIILADTCSMVWKELRDSGQTYGLYNELNILNMTVTEDVDVALSMGMIDLFSPEIYKKLFELIRNKVHLKYIDSEFEKAKRINLKSIIGYSKLFSTLDFSMSDYGVTFEDMVNRINSITKDEFIKYVESTLIESNCILIKPIKSHNTIS